MTPLKVALAKYEKYYGPRPSWAAYGPTLDHRGMPVWIGENESQHFASEWPPENERLQVFERVTPPVTP